LQPFVDRSKVAGMVVLVADRGKVLALEAVGFADIAAGTPMRHDTVFWIASQSKPITATALMMLVDEGRVSLDAPVARYLPEFKDQWLAVEQDKDHILLKKPKHPITVRNILSHTSGMPFKSEVEHPTLDLLPLRTGTRSYAMTPLQSFADARVAYLDYDILISMGMHGLTWGLAGMAGGLAFAVGLGRRKLLLRAAVAVLARAVLGAIALDLVSAFLFPLAHTGDPVSTTWPSRLVARLWVTAAIAGCVALVLPGPPRPRRRIPGRRSRGAADHEPRPALSSPLISRRTWDP
jgi:Beta-lactamase